MTEHPLERWLEDKKRAGNRVKKRDLADAVGCSPSRITQILNYGDAPSLALAAKLSEKTKIPIMQFVKKTEAAG